MRQICEKIRGLGYGGVYWEKRPKGRDKEESVGSGKIIKAKTKANFNPLLIVFTHIFYGVHTQAIYCFHTHKCTLHTYITHTYNTYLACSHTIIFIHIKYVHTSHTLHKHIRTLPIYTNK